MNKPRVCPDCQNTGRIRIVTQVGEFTHEREEYCSCPIGRKLDPEGTGEFPPEVLSDPPSIADAPGGSD